MRYSPRTVTTTASLTMGLIHKLRLPNADEALQGRDTPVPVPPRHFVNGAPLKPPFPAGSEHFLAGMGCFWGAERMLWETRGVITTMVGYAGGFTTNPDYYEVCSGMTAHNEVVLAVFDPEVVGYADLLKVFWEGHDPTQGMRQGNDLGTQYRSGLYVYDDRQRELALASKEIYQDALTAAWLRRHHHRDHRRAAVLLRGALPPAVPRQGAERLLRTRRHGRRLRGGDAGGVRRIASSPRTASPRDIIVSRGREQRSGYPSDSASSGDDPAQPDRLAVPTRWHPFGSSLLRLAHGGNELRHAQRHLPQAPRQRSDLSGSTLSARLQLGRRRVGRSVAGHPRHRSNGR